MNESSGRVERVVERGVGRRAPLRFLLRFATFLLVPTSIYLLAAATLHRFGRLQAYQDPRTRLLWDGKFDGSPLVLMGDSAFASYYVDRSEDTLWQQLGRLQRTRVFPAALNASRSADFLNAGRVIRQTWPAGTVVLLDVILSRLVVLREPANPLGTHARAFSHLLSPTGILQRIDHTSLEAFDRATFPSSSLGFMILLAKGALHGPPDWFRTGDYRNRVWDADSFAADRYRKFCTSMDIDAGAASLDWISETRAILGSRGIRLGVVLLPWNEALVQKLSPPRDTARYLRRFRQLTDGLRGKLAATAIPTLDLTGHIPSHCFADLLHSNTCGESIVAHEIDRWLRESASLSRSRRQLSTAPRKFGTAAAYRALPMWDRPETAPGRSPPAG